MNNSNGRLTAESLRRSFPDAKILRPPNDALSRHISDSELRRVLAEVGLPESLVDVVEVDRSIGVELRTVADVFRNGGDVPPPNGSGELIYLGFAGKPLLAVSGESGCVYQVYRTFGIRELSQSLETFLLVLSAMSRKIQEYWTLPDDISEDILASDMSDLALRELQVREPNAPATSIMAWRELCEDVAASAG